MELEAAPARPEDYADRNGYDAEFLGSEELKVPLPLPGEELESDLVPVTAALPKRPFELTYRNFSVVMSRRRRLCWISAVNINGEEPFFKAKRPGWRRDPRIPDEFQVSGDDFYVPTEFDRGHMVRRLDPVWGVKEDALQANKDTHHYTNSCPQIHSFNDQTWGDLEDWILEQEQTRESKASVFTGPIFGPEDPVYAKVAVPVRFFKLVVVVDDAVGRLSATAFVMDQSDVMPPLPEAAEPEAAFDPGAFHVHQVTLAELAADSGLNLDHLLPFDALAAHPAPEAAAGVPLRLPLQRLRDVVLWAPR